MSPLPRCTGTGICQTASPVPAANFPEPDRRVAHRMSRSAPIPAVRSIRSVGAALDGDLRGSQFCGLSFYRRRPVRLDMRAPDPAIDLLPVNLQCRAQPRTDNLLHDEPVAFGGNSQRCPPAHDADVLFSDHDSIARRICCRLIRETSDRVRTRSEASRGQPCLHGAPRTSPRTVAVHRPRIGFRDHRQHCGCKHSDRETQSFRVTRLHGHVPLLSKPL